MADIIIGDEQPRRIYTVGATPQSVFTVPFPFLQDADVRVVVNRGTADEGLSLGIDYTVSGAGQQEGSVTLAAPVSNCTVAVARVLPIERSTAFPAAGTLKMSALNREFDRVVMIDQQQQAQIDRTLKLAQSDDLGANATLPVAQQRANRLFVFDRDGRPIMSDVTVAQVEGAALAAWAQGNSLGDVPQYTGDGVRTRFPTGHIMTSRAGVHVEVGGVFQAPNSYGLDGEDVVMAEPPPSGVPVHIRVLGVPVQIADASESHVKPTGVTPTRKLEEWLGDLFAADGGVSPEGVKIRSGITAAFAPALQVGPTATGLTQLQYQQEIAVVVDGLEKARATPGGFGVMTGAGVASSGAYLKAIGHGNWLTAQASAAPNPIELGLYSSTIQGRATATAGGNALARVTGQAWTSAMVGRNIWFGGVKYRVSGVSSADQLTVTTTGGGAVSWGSTVTSPYFQVYTTGKGACNVSGTTVTRVSGDYFVPFIGSDIEFKLTIGGVTRTVSAYVNRDTLTLSSAPGDVSNAAYAYELNINDQLSTLRVQALQGSDEMNLAIFARPDYYGIASFLAGQGTYLPIRLGAGHTAPASPLWTFEINPDHTVRLGGVAGEESLKVGLGTVGGRAVTVDGASSSGSPVIGTTGGDLTIGAAGAQNNKFTTSGALHVGTASGSGGGRLRVTHNASSEPSIFSHQQALDGTVIYGLASHASFQQVISVLNATRVADAGYSFLQCYSGNYGDREFTLRGDGQAFADGSWAGGGADYAEMFEWTDGNPDAEDRRGLSVVLEGRLIRPAAVGEDPVGVVSAAPVVLGDAAALRWADKYLRDDFGAYVFEDYEVVGEDGTVVVQQRRKLNPEFDETHVYVPRAERREWSPVGLVGKLRLRRGQPTSTRWLKMRDISSDVEEWLVR